MVEYFNVAKRNISNPSPLSYFQYYTVQIILLIDTDNFHFMTKSKWLMVCYICEICIIVIFHPSHKKWKIELLI